MVDIKYVTRVMDIISVQAAYLTDFDNSGFWLDLPPGLLSMRVSVA